MIYYINNGFVAEQALVDVVKRYFDRQQLDDVYGNFHISVTNNHPFAHMIVEHNSLCADNFPSIVITTQNDNKPSDLVNMPAQYSAVGLTSEDLTKISESGYRTKTKINDAGEVVPVKKGGIIQKELIPGYIKAIDEASITKLKEVADSRTIGDIKGMVYGLKTEAVRRDKISVEIWCDNNQLKNELYEHLRILFSTNLDRILQESYSLFGASVYDGTVSGERSSNYNMDFDTILYGSHLTFDVDYNVNQLILDSDINRIDDYKEIIVEVLNHVKN